MEKDTTTTTSDFGLQELERLRKIIERMTVEEYLELLRLAEERRQHDLEKYGVVFTPYVSPE
jgi:ABC-type branched-subunit amino acid transport system ATPase component